MNICLASKSILFRVKNILLNKVLTKAFNVIASILLLLLMLSGKRKETVFCYWKLREALRELNV